MRRFSALILCLLVAGTLHAETLRIGVFPHYPVVMQQARDGEPYGPGVEYAKAIARALGYDPVIVLLPIARLLVYLKTGAIDMSLELGMNEERKSYLLYSDKPSIVFHPSLTVRSEHRLESIASIKDIAGMRIGYLLGAYTGSFFAGATGIEFDYVAGDTWIVQNLGKLLSGRIDAILDQNDYSCIAEARRQGVERQIKVLRLPGEGVKSYIVFSKASPKAGTLLRSFNALQTSEIPDESAIIEEFLRDGFHPDTH
jgi:ABC-type amino acid transport substrate-binding protein